MVSSPVFLSLSLLLGHPTIDGDPADGEGVALLQHRPPIIEVFLFDAACRERSCEASACLSVNVFAPSADCVRVVARVCSYLHARYVSVN